MSSATGLLSRDLLDRIFSSFPMPLNGLHGPSHWARVLENGERLAGLNGARLDVVRLFAVFHDSKRMNDDRDPGHGARGAKFAASLRDDLFDLPDEDFDRLEFACRFHTGGEAPEDLTVATCWDADRLDLGRVGIQPLPRRLCTAAARDPEILAWGIERSRNPHPPAWVAEEWGLWLE